MKKQIYFFIALFIISISAFAEEASNPYQRQLEEIRTKSGVKGIAVSIIDGDREPVILTSGFADIEARSLVTRDTQFRFGSVAKIFVAMSIMKLVEEEKLSLQDRVYSIAPEIEFNNPFSATHPLRVHHLLNHSTGWDAMRFAENIPIEPHPISLRDAINQYPASRESRWPPGSRIAYNNTGYLVGAYLVEKLSGTTYESFVQQHFLSPLGMQNTGFFYTDDYRKNAATLYLGDKPLPYAHLNNRPAGGINSNIQDMSRLVQFLLRQGRDNAEQVLSAQAMDIMQTPGGSLPTSMGLEVTHLQGLQQFNANGFTLFGHEGSVRGGSALLIYQPELNQGYVIAVNGEGPAIPAIHGFLSDILTRYQASEPPPDAQHFTEQQRSLAGLYKNISPAADLAAPFINLIPWRLTVAQDTAAIGPVFGGRPRPLTAGENAQFLQWQTNKVVLLQTSDPLAKGTIQYGPTTLKSVSAVAAYLPFIIVLTWLLSVISSLLFALWWLPRKWMGKQKDPFLTRLRSWSLITLAPVCIVVILGILAHTSADLNTVLGQPSLISVGFTLMTLLFFLSAVWSIKVWFDASKVVRKSFIYWHATLLIVLHAIIALYLLFNGLIAVRVWA